MDRATVSDRGPDREDERSEARDGEIKAPSTRDLIRWVIDYVRSLDPRPETVSKEDIVTITGLKWGSARLMRDVLAKAHEDLSCATDDPIEWTVNSATGLRLLKPAERVGVTSSHVRRGVGQFARAFRKIPTIDRTQLGGEDLKALDRTQVQVGVVLGAAIEAGCAGASREVRRKLKAQAEGRPLERRLGNHEAPKAK